MFGVSAPAASGCECLPFAVPRIDLGPHRPRRGVAGAARGTRAAGGPSGRSVSRDRPSAAVIGAIGGSVAPAGDHAGSAGRPSADRYVAVSRHARSRVRPVPTPGGERLTMRVPGQASPVNRPTAKQRDNRPAVKGIAVLSLKSVTCPKPPIAVQSAGPRTRLRVDSNGRSCLLTRRP